MVYIRDGNGMERSHREINLQSRQVEVDFENIDSQGNT